MPLNIFPLPAKNVNAWKAWSKALETEKKAEFDDFNRRFQLERHLAWLAETPSGPMVLVLTEGPGTEAFMTNMMSSNHKFDVWFRDQVSKLHEMDFTKPPKAPAPEQFIHFDAHLQAAH